MKILIISFFLLLSVPCLVEAQLQQFTATRMGTSYKSEVTGWHQETTYTSQVAIKIVIEPFLLTINNWQVDKYKLRRQINKWEGYDMEGGKHFVAERYNSIDAYNRWAVVTLYYWEDKKIVVQVQYADCTYFYSDIFN